MASPTAISSSGHDPGPGVQPTASSLAWTEQHAQELKECINEGVQPQLTGYNASIFNDTPAK